MAFKWQLLMAFAVSLALVGCGSSVEKQVSQLSETVKSLEQQVSGSKEAIAK